MVRSRELSWVGGPAEWEVAKQREEARRAATAQRRSGYKQGCGRLEAPPWPAAAALPTSANRCKPEGSIR